MPEVIIEKKERVSKGKGTAMVCVALLFDFSVFIILLSSVFFFFHSVIGLSLFEKLKIAFFLGAPSLIIMLMFGPFLYLIFTWVNAIIAYTVFYIWFFSSGVHILSFEKPKKMIVTSSSFLLEAIPVLNLLPGITAMVYLNVRMARKEDDEAHKALLASTQKRLRAGRNSVIGYPQYG